VFVKTSGGFLVKKLNDLNIENNMSLIKQVASGYQIFYICIMLFLLMYFEWVVSLFGVTVDVVSILLPIKWRLFLYVLLSAMDVVLGSYFVSKQKNNINFKSQFMTILLLIVVVGLVLMTASLSLLWLWLMLVGEKLGLVVYKSVKLYSENKKATLNTGHLKSGLYLKNNN